VFDDDLLLTGLIAARIGVELDHHALRAQLNAVGAAKERTRLARDLHDGVLQGLAAANIQLKLASAVSSDEIRDQIGRTRELLVEEQILIRAFVEQTRSQSAHDNAQVELAPDLEQRSTRLSQHWGCEVRYTVTPRDLKADPTIARQLRSMVDEAVSNAVRHGKASQVRISAYQSGDRLCLSIEDNGRGFAAAATSYNKIQVTTQHLAPLSLKSRVADLGGMLNVVTSHSGTKILIEVPHEQE
jgi:signal transduction histidine kinase